MTTPQEEIEYHKKAIAICKKKIINGIQSGKRQDERIKEYNAMSETERYDDLCKGLRKADLT